MIDVKIEKGNVERLMAMGSMSDIGSELGLAIALTYSSFENQSHEAGEAFKKFFKECIVNTCFDENLLAKEGKDDDDDDTKKDIRKVINALKTLTEYIEEDDDDLQHLKS